jgi:hypothetical protein
MVAPALIATPIPGGTHHVVFRYAGFRGYPPLFALSLLSLLALAASERSRKPRRDVAPRKRPSAI